MRWMVRAGTIVLIAIVLAGADVAPGAEAPVGGEILDLLQIPAAERHRLARGEILSYPVNENGERELVAGLAMFVPASVSQLAPLLADGQLLAQDNTISAYGVISDEHRSGALPGVRFSGGERDEAESLLDASPGSRFNLSAAEIDALHALRSSAGASTRTAVAELVSDEYRRFLRQRWQAYQQGGLAAMAPYARNGGAVTDPAAELRRAASDADRLTRDGSDLREALLRYPAAQPPRVLNRFYWVKRQVQRRPTLSLMHQMVMGNPDLIVHVERYFYVGHSYNAAQIITGGVPYQNGAVVFATSRFSTDEILGVGSTMKRTIGRAQLKDEMRKRFDRLRASLTRPPSAQSP